MQRDGIFADIHRVESLHELIRATFKIDLDADRTTIRSGNVRQNIGLNVKVK
jgi:hypothetical protein